MNNQWHNNILGKVNAVFRRGSIVVSILFLLTLLVSYGFVLSEWEEQIVGRIYSFAWLFYIIAFTYSVVVLRSQIARKSVVMTSIVGFLLYLSLLPEIFNTPDTTGWWLHVWQFLESRSFVVVILTILSVTDISRGVIGFINKKTNPALLLTAGFAVIILLGAILLLLPRSTFEGISVVDALFISTSAVCVTGLTSVDVATTFTHEGLIVIILLIQIGGLGVMTLTSFFAIFFMGSTGLYNQFAIKDMVNSDTFSSLVSTLLYILGFTFIIELCGAALIWADIHSTMGMTPYEELFFSLFHSVSAFCNAGFSTLNGNLGNPLIMSWHNGFYLTISALIALGGIGFPILVNFKEVLFHHVRSLYRRLFDKGAKPMRLRHITNLNTKIVLVTTAVLILGGTLAIAMLEWNNAFYAMDVGDKLTQSLFNAISPRTAGFSSVDLTRFALPTIIIYMFLMWIGGAAQSTAGGIKVNAIAVAFSNFISTIKGSDRVDMYGRELSPDTIRRASATVFGSIIAIVVFVYVLIVMEPNIAPLHLLFEVISAIGTVGSSLNTTSLLGDGSKVLLVFVMFIGRVGLITIMMSIIPARAHNKYRFPKDKVIIN